MCEEQCSHQQPVLRNVYLFVYFFCLCPRQTFTYSLNAHLCTSWGQNCSPMCTCLQLLPLIPSNSTVRIYVDVWLQVCVYVKHMHTHMARDMEFTNSAHRLDGCAPSADADPHLPGIALTCSCSPTAGQMHNLPAQHEGSGFWDQKEH